ncbi:MAG: hypothetical protein V1848_02500 [Candidatus Magasanikbacteria bacterium]
MYLSWNKKNIGNITPATDISSLYNEGYVFTRIGKGEMDQTRSVRINLSQCELTSENKRILKKTEDIQMDVISLPFKDYHWEIGKIGKDFYDSKFGEGIFSANKIKEILVEKEKSNFNLLLQYSISDDGLANEYCHCKITTDENGIGKTQDMLPLGYAICYENADMLHYSYPFYNLLYPNKNLGMGMMVRAVQYAKEQRKKYIYLGSAQRPTDTYKFQFKGMEWFDGTKWNTDLEELKEILAK